MTDRPWGVTLAALGVRRCTGQLTLQAEGRRYCIVFENGAVIGATSPLASDSAARVALIHHMIAPAQAADLTRRVAAAPERDEIELLADAARLTLDQTLRLRRKVIEQRAARTFSIDEGEFVIDSRVDAPLVSGFAVDVRSVIYLGARMNLSELRLGNELRRLGVRFSLRPEAAGELPHFGFSEAEQPILDALRAGTTVAELEARHRDLDPRTVQAVIYALASCSICTGEVPPELRADASEAAAADVAAVRKRAQTTPPASEVYSRTRTGRDVFVTRAPTGGSRPATDRTLSPAPFAGRTPERTPSRGLAAIEGAPRPPATRAPTAGPDETGVPRGPRTSTPASLPPTRVPPRASTQSDGGGAVPAGRGSSPGGPGGMPATARTRTPSSPPATARAPAPPAAARTPTPRDLPSVDRTPTPTGLSRTRTPGTINPPVTDAPAEAPEALVDPLAGAKEAFRRGQSRLRVENLEDAIVDLTRAVELAPNEVDYAATLAWARFCHATDKPSLAPATREALGKAIRKSATPEMARFYLGRVERMLGRDKEALRHFQEVLDAQPKHADAAAEVRAIEARMAQAAAKESGVFGRKR